MSWTISSSGYVTSSGVITNSGTVTMPYAPQTVTDKAATIDDTVPIPEGEPTLISVGSDVRQVTVEGFFYAVGGNIGTIDSSYVTPLLNFRGLLCTLATPRSSINGVWKLDDATFTQSKDNANQAVIMFSLTFKHAKVYVVL